MADWKISDEWARRLPLMWRKLMNVRVSGAATCRNTEDTLAIHVSPQVVQEQTTKKESGYILVNLTEDGTGSAGNATTACTFKYDVYPFEGGAALATGVSPWFGRGAGQKNPATRGMARYVGGTLLLIQTDESLVIRTGGCS